MRQILQHLQFESLAFPPLECALTEPNGLLAIGGDLSSKRLINAYRHGIFPWYSENDPLMWWSPNPRAIIYTDNIKVNRTLQKALKKTQYQVTLNQAFPEVIKYCADAPFRKEETWIVNDMQNAYLALHNKGFAHSIEVWMEGELVGGLYGVAINGYFSGESMFYKKSNASKFALIHIAQLLETIDIKFIDCQMLNPFLADMGAIEISRDEFVRLKDEAIQISVPDNFWRSRIL
ncbi:leucyl/phenylalanyl-tRNA--protein transferase [Colwelliaceae bacterium 6471]